MKLNPKKMAIQDRRGDILATGGVHIGGDDFDAAIMWHKLAGYFGYGSQYEEMGRLYDFPIHFFTRLCSWYDIAQLKEPPYGDHLRIILRGSTSKDAVDRLRALIQDDLGFAVFKAIEAAKKSFSTTQQTSVRFQSKSLNFDLPITLPEFEDYIAEHIADIDRELEATLERAHCKDSDIDSVFLTGGSSLVDLVQRTITARFPHQAIVADANRFTSVVTGLALSNTA